MKIGWIILMISLLGCQGTTRSSQPAVSGKNPAAENLSGNLNSRPENSSGVSLTLPEEWQWIDSVPIRLTPIHSATGCSEQVSPANPATLESRTARYKVGGDTVYIDRVRAIYWPWGSYGGCQYVYRDLTSDQRTLLQSFYDLEQGASVGLKDKHFYEAIPSLFLLEGQGKPFVYVNQTSERAGEEGCFFPGDEETLPLNIYGYQLDVATLNAIRKYMEGRKWD